MAEGEVLKIPLTRGKVALVDAADTEEEAAQAYDAAAMALFGPFASLNFGREVLGNV